MGEDAGFFYRGPSQVVAEDVLFFPSFGTCTAFICNDRILLVDTAADRFVGEVVEGLRGGRSQAPVEAVVCTPGPADAGHGRRDVRAVPRPRRDGRRDVGLVPAPPRALHRRHLRLVDAERGQPVQGPALRPGLGAGAGAHGLAAAAGAAARPRPAYAGRGTHPGGADFDGRLAGLDPRARA